MSLAQIIAQRRAQERAEAARRANPELEAKLDRFIEANPQLRERFSAMTKEEIVRTVMAARMERAEATARASQELKQWVGENPEIVAKIEERFKNIAAENRAALRRRIATRESVNQGQRGPRFRP